MIRSLTKHLNIQALKSLVELSNTVFKKLNERSKKDELKSLAELSNTVFKQLNERSKSDLTMTGLPTGFKVIDEKTGGLQKGNLIIIAGRPSKGKTSLALNIAGHVAIEKQQGTVAVFSLEMPAEDIVSRLFSLLAKINQMNMRDVNLDGEEWASVTKWQGLFKKASLYIDDSSSLTPIELCSRVRRLKREHDDLALVVVDYLQLMHMDRNTENRAVEISGISRALKSLAREIKIPVVALSQLNRNIESRKTKPQISDLREAAAIEQDADVIMFIYSEQDKEGAPGGKARINDNVVTVDVVKQRNGPIFETKLTFISMYTRFENYISERVA